MQKEMADIFILIARIDKTAPTQQLQAPVKRKSMNASAFFFAEWSYLPTILRLGSRS